MLRWLGRTILKLGGWTPVGDIPDEPKVMFIAAPHTSYWDAVWALAYIASIGLKASFFAKQSAFFFPIGNILRAMGGIELDRGRPGTAVQQAIEQFEQSESFYFGLAPEGTRRKTAGWKSGFYRIATGANVPLYLGFLDFGRRRIGIGPRVDLTGDIDTDMAVIREFYKDIDGRWPEKASPIKFL